VHGAKPDVSRLQTKVDLGSLLEKAKVAVALVDAEGGPDAIVVCGGTVSTVHEYCDGGPVSNIQVARTESVCEPLPSPVRTLGGEQAANFAPSREQSNVLPSLSALKPNVAVVRLVSTGGVAVNVTCGATVFTVHVALCSALFPAASVARTSNPCGPAGSVRFCGLAQAANCSVSNRHSTLAMPEPESVALKTNATSGPVTGGGRVRDTLGGVSSSVYVNGSEQAETSFPLVAVAKKVVLVSALTDTAIWKVPLDAGPVANAVPGQLPA
jgi:hypothetical protein